MGSRFATGAHLDHKITKLNLLPEFLKTGPNKQYLDY